MSIIQPRTLKGFRDLTPQQARLRADLVRTLEDVFRAHGYGPIDTPALEYAEILKGKGADVDKELFEFTDKGGREVALRFDLTVPLARYVAQHQGTLAFPFRRYHLGPVWRGERPQRGRFREFWQCDADIVGPETAEADAEILVLMLSAYEALGVGTVTLRINDRRVLSGLLEQMGTPASPLDVLRAIDKREKQGNEVVHKELTAAGMSDADIERVLDVCAPQKDDDSTLAMLRQAVGANATGAAGVAGLERVRTLVQWANKPLSSLRVDPSIARGLDYYTGIVLEAQLDDLPDIGSVGSGGRYDDLAGLYSKKNLPGVGCSIGIDRLLTALEELDRASAATDESVMITNAGGLAVDAAFRFAATLRDAGVAADVYPEARKHGAQMKHADRRGVAFVFTPNEDGSYHGKRLSDGASQHCADADAALAWIHGVSQ